MPEEIAHILLLAYGHHLLGNFAGTSPTQRGASHDDWSCANSPYEMWNMSFNFFWAGISFSKLTARNTRSTVAINRWVLGYVYANSTSTSFAILRTSMSAAERLFPGKAEGKNARSLGNTETGNKRRSTVYVLGSVTTAFDVSSRSQRYRRNCGEIDE